MRPPLKIHEGRTGPRAHRHRPEHRKPPLDATPPPVPRPWHDGYLRLYAVIVDKNGRTGAGVPLSHPMPRGREAEAAGLQLAADAALAARLQEVLPGASRIVLQDHRGGEVRSWPVLGVSQPAVEPEREPFIARAARWLWSRM